jgi:hypothetical protein
MNDILEGLEISDSQENTNEINDDPDRNALRKKYLLRLDELSFKFRIWTHPFRLLQTMLILAFLTFVAYIFRNHNCINDAYKLLHSFAGVHSNLCFFVHFYLVFGELQQRRGRRLKTKAAALQKKTAAFVLFFLPPFKRGTEFCVCTCSL